MLSSIIAYLMIAAPSITAVASIIFVIVVYINKMRIKIAEANSIVAESKAVNEEMQQAPEWKELLNKLGAENEQLRRINAELIKALTENTEAWTRVRNKYPKLFSNEESNDE